MAQMVEHLPSKRKTLTSTPKAANKKNLKMKTPQKVDSFITRSSSKAQLHQLAPILQMINSRALPLPS
jgi:hypothetical protein